MRILVIDDTQANLASAIVTLHGHELVTEGDAEKAHSLIRNERWDAILTDLWMPTPQGMSAFGVGLDPSGMQDDAIKDMMPIGLVFALMAVTRGVKYVGVLTETNHHRDRLTAALDGVRIGESPRLTVMDCGLFRTETGAKNWGALLRLLTENVWPTPPSE